MPDRRTKIYNYTVACLSGDAKRLADIADEVSRVLGEKHPGEAVSQVDVLVAVSVLGKATIRVIEQDNGIWLERISAT